MEELLPVVGVVVGWLLSSLTSRRSDRRDRRRAIGRGLAEGIELRRRLCVPAEEIREELVARMGPGYELQDADATLFDEMLAVWVSELPLKLDGLSAALCDLAGEDPILAEEIKSILHLQDVDARMDRFRKMLDVDISGEEWSNVMKVQQDYFVELLDRALRILARQHGFVTAVRLHRLLRNWNKIPKPIKPMLDRVVARIHALPLI